jgi:glutamyl-tRNA synthetase
VAIWSQWHNLRKQRKREADINGFSHKFGEILNLPYLCIKCTKLRLGQSIMYYNSPMTVRTRIAPSPTGQDMHVGTLATALANFAWAKKNGGQFIVRIEDTDRSRIVGGGESKMLETLEYFGLTPDESPLVGGAHGPYRQSERLDIYKKHVNLLMESGSAYYCTCTPERLDEMRKSLQSQKKIPKYDRQCLHNQKSIKAQIQAGVRHVVRMIVPEDDIVFEDVVRGKVAINGSNIDDQIIMKSDGYPTYHLAVVVDDHLMGITHVLRGEEWLPSTPKHILLYRYFGWELPVFGHLPLLRNPDKSKLSKRKNPVWSSDFIRDGMLKEAMLNYLAQMGWSHPEGKDIFDLDEYINVFDIKDIQKTAPIFDLVKLCWLNGEYIRQMSDDRLTQTISEYLSKYHQDTYTVISKNLDIFHKSIPLIKSRIKKLSEYFDLCDFLFVEPIKESGVDLGEHELALTQTANELAKVNDWSHVAIGESLSTVCEAGGLKRSDYFMLIRKAITGKKISPPLNECMEILGQEVCIRRLKRFAK